MGAERYAVLVGIFRDPIDAHLAQLAWLLAAVWVVGLGVDVRARVLAVVPGARAGRRHHPSRRTDRQGEFTARLDPPASQDEVGQMTRSLNDVLDRLHGALEAHRRFASDASHELRSPIAAMAGEIEVTLKYPRTAAEYRETLAGDRRSTGGADRAVRRPDSARARAGGCHRRGAAGGARVAATGGLRGSGWRVRRRPAGSPSQVRDLPDLVAYADPRLLARVFDNVLANAVHYNRDGGAVVISGSAEESAPDEWKAGTALITVTDTGPGIPLSESERVFDRFYRLDQSRARRTGGSGLGLAICREVLTVLGGSIRISASSTEGTTFEISVPGRIASDRRFSQALACNSLSSAG